MVAFILLLRIEVGKVVEIGVYSRVQFSHIKSFRYFIFIINCSGGCLALLRVIRSSIMSGSTSVQINLKLKSTVSKRKILVTKKRKTLVTEGKTLTTKRIKRFGKTQLLPVGTGYSNAIIIDNA